MSSKKLILSLVLFFAVPPLFAAEGAINWPDLLLKTFNFAVLVGLLAFFITKPVAKWLRRQLSTEQQSWDVQQTKRKLARDKLDEQQQKLYDIDNQIKKIKETGALQAEWMCRQIESEHEAQIAVLKKQFEERIGQYQLAKEEGLQQLLLVQVHQMVLQKIEANKQSIDHALLVQQFVNTMGQS